MILPYKVMYNQLMERHLCNIKKLITEDMHQKEISFLKPAIEDGKMLRPKLCLLTAQAFGRPITHKTYLLAAALECVHLASLLHDDIIDTTHMRRGQPSTWVQRGVPSAILAGDYLLAHSLTLANRAQDSEALRIVANKTKLVIRGEILQHQEHPPLWPRTLYTRITALKTSSLFEAALLLFTPQQYEATMERVGTFLGIAFQVLNDIKDYAFLWTEQPPGPDVISRRISAPLLYFLHNSATPHTLLNFWQQNTLSPLVEALRQESASNMLCGLHKTIAALTNKAHTACNPIPTRAKNTLLSFITNTLPPQAAPPHALHA